MTLEEKARAYDEAIEKARKELQTCGSKDCDAARQIYRFFPELQDLEDERIRKAIIEFFEFQDDNTTYSLVSKKDILAWLEKQGEQETDEWKEGNIIRHGGILALVIRGRRVMKSNGEIFTVQYPDEWVKAAPKEIEHFLNEFEKQGEQPQGKTALEAAKEEKVDNQNCVKPTDKVEPKFKAGDWITGNSINNDTIQINSVDDRFYWHDNNRIGGRIDAMNKAYHLCIADAKDGDILVNGSNIFIFSHLSDTRAMGYCHINLDDGRFYDDKGKNECFGLIDAVFSPATKEQRELLFAKMREEGFEWDKTKKELRKIEQKSKWTDEDEERLQSCIIALQGKGLMGGVDTMDSKWLKSLKQRIYVNSAKPCKNDTLYDLLHKMPSYITVDGIFYHFILRKTALAYTAYYAGEEEGSGKVIFAMTAFSPIDLLNEMLEKLKKEGLLE